MTRLDLERIRAARGAIDRVFLNTPLYQCESLGRALGCTVSIKLETANPVRSFKGRGTELVTGLLAGQGRTAVVCASAGNLGQALAWSGRSGGLGPVVHQPGSAQDAIGHDLAVAGDLSTSASRPNSASTGRDSGPDGRSPSRSGPAAGAGLDDPRALSRRWPRRQS